MRRGSTPSSGSFDARVAGEAAVEGGRAVVAGEGRQEFGRRRRKMVVAGLRRG